jgi:hypothetical protein
MTRKNVEGSQRQLEALGGKAEFRISVSKISRAVLQPSADWAQALSRASISSLRWRSPMSSKSWREILPVHPATDLFPHTSQNELRELGEGHQEERIVRRRLTELQSCQT